MQLNVFQSRSSEMSCGRSPTDHLICRQPRESFISAAQLLKQFRFIGQGLNCRSNTIARCVISGRNQKAEEVSELSICHFLSVFGFAQHQVQCAKFFTFFNTLHQIIRVIKKLNSCRRPKREQAVFIGIDLINHEICVIRIRVRN